MSIERKLYMLQMNANLMTFRHRPHPKHLLDGRQRAGFREFRDSIKDLLVGKRIKNPEDNKAIVERSTPRSNCMFVLAPIVVIEEIRRRFRESDFGSVIPCASKNDEMAS